MGPKSYQKIVVGPNYKKILLKNRLSKCVRNFATLNEPLNIFFKMFLFEPQSCPPKRLYGVKIMKIRAFKNLTLGHLAVKCR
jgi:hypothetical protein